TVKSVCLIAMILVLATTQITQAQPGIGQVWEKYEDNPVCNLRGANGTWNDVLLVNVQISGHPMWDDPIYRYYGSGYDGSLWGIGLWTADDLEGPWEEYEGNPMIGEGEQGSWNENGIGCPMVIKDGDTLKMWYVGTDDNFIYSIGYAFSTDGVNWTEYEENPVLERSGNAWDLRGVYMPYVIKNGDTYEMWYNGQITTNPYTQRIGYASSEDGVNWTAFDENPVLNVGNTGEWNTIMVQMPVVDFDGELYRMWFGGSNNAIYKIGFAISEDGTDWTVDPNNPVIEDGTVEDWDVDWAAPVGVLVTDDTWQMVYMGGDLTITNSLGLATFIGHPPADFELASPEDDAILNVDTVTVSWNPASDIDEGDELRYIVECSLGRRFQEGETFADTTLDTFYVFTDVPEELAALGGELDELPDDETIYWCVRVVDNTDLFTWANGDDDGWSFDTYLPDPPVAFNLLTPENESRLEGTTAMFSWDASEDPDPGSRPRYDVWLDTLPDLSTATQITDSLYARDFTLRDLELDHDFYWTVRATDDNTDGTWASDTFFFNTHQPDAVDGELLTGIPTEYSIISAYPNPFNPATSISIGLPESSELKINVYNITGQNIAVLANERLSPGYHQFTFKADGLSSGIYFIHATVPGKMNELRKVVLVR
ncbi:MAG: T9SS type A sorting domain-containing protein, partial [Candidatus Electryonea clarkiae]|nr:T9SS type A sorting domain-containing protein [Candidatus Electryonea clarkiae]